jgi:hypothetical protein
MDQTTKAVIAGLVFGLLAAVIMLPMDFGSKDKKRDAIIAAFIERFSIGFVIPLITLSVPHYITGLFLGTLLSLPSAIVTKTFAPILIVGALGGLIIGLLT